MIPTGNWSCESKPKKFRKYSKPLPEQRYGTVYDVKIGASELSQSDGRLDSNYWIIYQNNTNIVIRKAIDNNNWSSPIVLFEEADTISDISLSFDNLGRPVVAYQKVGGIFLWFYDSQLGDETIKTISTSGITPVIDFDIKEDTSSTDADIMLYYVRNDGIYYRLQRDRFDIEYFTGISEPNIKLEKCGTTEDNRFQVVYVFDDLRDGALLQKKVLESNSSIGNQLQNKNLTLNFTIAKSPSICELRSLYNKYGEGWNGWFCVAQHGGNHQITGHPQEEHLFTLEFRLYDPLDADENRVIVAIRRTRFSEGEYLTSTLDYSALGVGDYILRFTQDAPVASQPMKRIELIKDTTTLIDQVVADLPSVNSGTNSTRNRLRFGASTEYNVANETNYKFIFPAVFTDISTVYDGVTTTWNKQYSDQTTESTPSGNPLTLRKAGYDNSYQFYEGYIS